MVEYGRINSLMGQATQRHESTCEVYGAGNEFGFTFGKQMINRDNT